MRINSAAAKDVERLVKAQLALASAKQKLADTQAGATQAQTEAARGSLALAQASVATAKDKYNQLLNPSAARRERQLDFLKQTISTYLTPERQPA